MIAYLYHSKGMITTKNGTAKELAAQMEVQGALDNHSVSQDGADRYIDCPLIGRLVSHWSPRYGWGGWYSKEHSAWLRRERDVRGSIEAAEMRIG